MKLIAKIVAYPLITVNMAISVMLIISAYCSLLAPVGNWPLLSLSGLAFPLLFLGNLFFLFLWLSTWKKGALIPSVTLAAVMVPFMHYCPFNLFGRNAGHDLTVISYNTEGFGLDNTRDRSSANPVLQHVCSFQAQIICLQEAKPDVFHSIDNDKDISALYPYRILDESSGQACLSSYPILEHSIIDFGTAKGNKCLFMKILACSDTIDVFNCHMQTNYLKKKDFNDSRQNIALDPSVRVVKKLLRATTLRAGQARIIASMAQKSSKAIVLGDFNDTPLSYAHRQFDLFMDDCFAKSGFGPGFTYHEHHLLYRIDHIFCNSAFSPVRCKVDRNCKQSDHYPIIASLNITGSGK